VKIEQKLAKREGRNLKATSEKINESHSNRRFFERIGLNFKVIHAKIQGNAQFFPLNSTT